MNRFGNRIFLLSLLAALACSSSTTAPDASGDASDAATADSAADSARDDSGVTDSGASDAPVDSDIIDGGALDPVVCGDTTCGADEYCIVPCCGGPAPGCLPREDDGSCPPGTSDTGKCFEGSDYCQMDPCTPEPPRCEPLDLCTGGECPPTGDCYDSDWSGEERTLRCWCA